MSTSWNERVPVRTAGKDYRAMLMDEEGPVPADEMPGLWALWNEAVGAKAPGDAGWLAKVTKGSKSLEEYQWTQASRLGMALVRMKDLPTWEAETGERWQVLAMQRLKLVSLWAMSGERRRLSKGCESGFDRQLLHH